MTKVFHTRPEYWYLGISELKRNIPRLDDRKIPLLSSYLSQFQYTDLIIHFERYDEEMVELLVSWKFTECSQDSTFTSRLA
ncbi:hypothetical protein D918_08272 [Trichuris suis]|nr:hypothetical protein D918_08272 [Trichuris suis]